MNVLIIGSGAREHALTWAIARSPLLGRLYCAPGNPGMAEIAACVPLAVVDHSAVIAFCRAQEIGLVVVGPEGPLVAGLVDDLEAAGLRAFGPGAAAARLEGSKGFTKDLCRSAGIPTAAYERFTDRDAATAYLQSHPLPVVVKADGLAAGKGVVIAETLAEAVQAVDACFSGRFGQAGAEIVVEEFLAGEEASFFALVDGERVIALASAQDHKRAGDGDTGPNTGGMGAYSPAPVMTPAVTDAVMARIIQPTVTAMAARGTPFKGVLFAGLMIGSDGPKLIEYNVRFGDPECQVLMLRLASDVLAALSATADGDLSSIAVAWHDQAALAVVMAANGYPGTPATGTEIRGLDAAGRHPDVTIFHAGTRREGQRLVADGGRVLSVVAVGDTVGDAQARCYAAIADIDWPGGFCRHDIGWRAIAPSDASRHVTR